MWRPRKSIVAGALAGLLLLTGCGGGGGTGGSASGGGDRSATGEVDPNATFRYVFVQNPSTFDPQRSGNPWDALFYELVYDQLIQRDSQGEFQPGLATSWEFVDDNTAFEMELRDDVDFIDGEHFDASVVKANIERAKTLETSTLRGSLERVESVEVLDDYKVRFNLNNDAGYLPALLSSGAGSMISPAAFDNEDLDQNPVGSGMAKVTEFIPGQVVRMDRNDDYWDPEAAKAAHYEILAQTASPTRVNMLSTGQGNMTYLMPQDGESAEAAGLKVDKSVSSTYFAWHLNTGRPPFDDIRVRQALEHAVDRQAIIDGVFFGAGQPLAQYVAPDHWAYDPEVTPDNPDYAYNPEKAKELLAEAGYPDGLEFDMVIPALDDHRAISEAVIPMLEEVGMVAHPQVVESPTLGVAFYTEQVGDAFIGASAPMVDPTLQYQYNLEGQFANPWGLVSDDFTAAWNESLVGATNEERIPGIHKMIEAEKRDLRRSIPIMLFEPPAAWTPDLVFPEGYKPAYRPNFRGVGVAAD